MAVLSQLPSTVDISFLAGDTFKMRVRVIDPDTSEPEDLSAYKFCAEIAKVEDHMIVAEFAVELALGSGPNPAPGEDGTAVILTLSPDDTAVLPNMGNGKQFRGVWDLEVTFPSGDVRTVASGAVTCGIDVSHCSASGPSSAP